MGPDYVIHSCLHMRTGIRHDCVHGDGGKIIPVYSSTKLYNLTSDTELLRELNTQIHSQIKEVLSKDAVAVVNHDQIDINHLIDEIPQSYGKQ